MIEVLYQHSDFYIINKPAGISVQNEQDASGILPLLCEQLDCRQLWLVHRLDKVTSGCLVVARHAQAASYLSERFRTREVDKFYLAISDKKPSKKQGSIVGGMKKIRDGKWVLTRDKQNLAVTQFFTTGTGTGHRLFLLKPHTGKTHQLRVALKSLGSPILGDTHYTGQVADRTYLHAYQLHFNYYQEFIKVEAPLQAGEHFINDTITAAKSKFQSPEQLTWPKLSVKLSTDSPL